MSRTASALSRRRLEDGILHTSYALLALTTAFFDAHRAHAPGFYIYPQHFAIIGADESGVSTGAGRLDLTLDAAASAWGWLDVWPESNWISSPASATAILHKVYDFHINQLFWPQDLIASDAPQADLLPEYARRVLRTRLKSVYYYNSPAPTVEISAAQPAVEIVQESIGRLPTAVQRTLSQEAPPRQESYRQVKVDDFLQDMESCFAD